MKRIFLLFTIFSCMMLALSSCNMQEQKALSIAEKVQADEPVSEADYDVLLNYFQSIADDINAIAAADKSDEWKQAEAEKLDKKYPHAEQILDALTTAFQDDRLNPEQYRRFQEIGLSLFNSSMVNLDDIL